MLGQAINLVMPRLARPRSVCQKDFVAGGEARDEEEGHEHPLDELGTGVGQDGGGHHQHCQLGFSAVTEMTRRHLTRSPQLPFTILMNATLKPSLY